jgi:lipoprotein NlpI
LELNPRDPLSHFKRGLALELMGKNQKAIDDFTEAIFQQSNNAQFLLARAFIHHANHDDTSANNDISRAHGVDPAVPSLIKFSSQ